MKNSVLSAEDVKFKSICVRLKGQTDSYEASTDSLIIGSPYIVKTEG